jgi:hypothetical protein
MTLLEEDRRGRRLVSVQCDGCPRSVRSDVLSAAELCEVVSWRRGDGMDLCVLCLWRSGTAPAFARRVAEPV